MWGHCRFLGIAFVSTAVLIVNMGSTKAKQALMMIAAMGMSFPCFALLEWLILPSFRLWCHLGNQTQHQHLLRVQVVHRSFLNFPSNTAFSYIPHRLENIQSYCLEFSQLAYTASLNHLDGCRVRRTSHWRNSNCVYTIPTRHERGRDWDKY